MSQRHPHDETQARRQRRIDFDVLGPLVLLGFLASIIAVALSLAAIGSNDNNSTADVAPAASTSASSMPGMESTAAPEDLKADFTMKPYNPVTKPVAPGPKTFELVATEKNIKVGDKVYSMWTFNNSVPGPVLRAVVGDKITIKISNDKTSKLNHSVDYHASRMTLGGGNLQVEPGKKGEYTFTAEFPGVFMYHCATAPVLHHIGMGMYGMLIVQPKEGFGKPMPEYALTQSELYANGDHIDTNTPDAMAFNGIPSQYIQAPIKVKANSNMRLFVLNAGPSEQSSFHVIGTIFDTAFADGNPKNVTYGRQALGIPTSGGAVFEMFLRGEGQYPFVTHQFNLAAKGAIGMILAGDGKPGPGAIEDAGANGHH